MSSHTLQLQGKGLPHTLPFHYAPCYHHLKFCKTMHLKRLSSTQHICKGFPGVLSMKQYIRMALYWYINYNRFVLGREKLLLNKHNLKWPWIKSRKYIPSKCSTSNNADITNQNVKHATIHLSLLHHCTFFHFRTKVSPHASISLRSMSSPITLQNNATDTRKIHFVPWVNIHLPCPRHLWDHHSVFIFIEGQNPVRLSLSGTKVVWTEN